MNDKLGIILNKAQETSRAQSYPSTGQVLVNRFKQDRTDFDTVKS